MKRSVAVVKSPDGARTISSGTSTLLLRQRFSTRSASSAVGDDRHRHQVVGRDRPRVRDRLEHAGVDVVGQDHHAVPTPRRLPVGRHPQALGDARRSGCWMPLNRSTISGMTMIGTHAPLVNFVIATISSTTSVAIAPTALSTTLRCHPGFRSRRWWRTIPDCDSVNDVNTPDRVQRDQGVGDAVERDQQRGGRRRQHDDAVREHEPVAAVRELARQVAVLGDDRRQAREPVVRGVRGEGEDRRGGELQEHERGTVAEHGQAHLRHHRAVVARVRLEVVREHRHAEEQRAEEHPHPHQRGRRVLRLRAPERGHAVRDRLDAGERDRARREALEQQEDAERAAALERAVERLGVERHR